MIRRFGRRRARRRWRRKLGNWLQGMKGRGYGKFSGLGRGYQQGFKAGQQSMMGRMRPYPGMRRGYPPPRGMGYYRRGGGGGGGGFGGGYRGGFGGRGLPPISGGLGSLPPAPRLRPLSNSKVPLPPRIQLIDLPVGHPMRRGGYSARAMRRYELVFCFFFNVFSVVFVSTNIAIVVSVIFVVR